MEMYRKKNKIAKKCDKNTMFMMFRDTNEIKHDIHNKHDKITTIIMFHHKKHEKITFCDLSCFVLFSMDLHLSKTKKILGVLYSPGFILYYMYFLFF